MSENDNNWGNKRSEYYEKNKRTKDDDNYIEEEEEAIKIQQTKLRKLKEVNLLDSDEEQEEDLNGDTQIKSNKNNNYEKYNLDSSDEENELKMNTGKTLIQNKKTKKTGKNLNSIKSLTNEEQEEQLQILKNIKINIEEVENNLNPIVEIIQNEVELDLNLNQTEDYLKSKKNIHLLYTTLMLYYVYFKNQNKISDHHPVIKKMYYLRTLMQQSKNYNESIFLEIDKVLKLIEANKIILEDDLEEEEELEIENEDNLSTNNNGEQKLLNRKRAKDLISENSEKIQKLRNEKENNIKKEKKKLEKEIDNKNFKGVRLANDNILKAKGIFRKRKKYQGNAKLHLREKFFKKEKQRKNFVKEYQGKPEVYGGEATGIRRDLIRSTKMK